jgi:putative transposase
VCTPSCMARPPRRALADRAADAQCGASGSGRPCRGPRTTDSRHGYPIAPNRLARNFTAAAPNKAWLADLTVLQESRPLDAVLILLTPTGEGWL